MKPAKSLRVIFISSDKDDIERLSNMLEGRLAIVAGEEDALEFQEHLTDVCSTLNFEVITLSPENIPFINQYFNSRNQGLKIE